MARSEHESRRRRSESRGHGWFTPEDGASHKANRAGRPRRKRRRRRSMADAGVIELVDEQAIEVNDPKEERAVGLLIVAIVGLILAICLAIVWKSLDWDMTPLPF
jgi:preprotein translocase subunit Sec61beta